MTKPNESPAVLPEHLPPAAPFSDETDLTLAQRRDVFRRRYGREPSEDVLAVVPAPDAKEQATLRALAERLRAINPNE